MLYMWNIIARQRYLQSGCLVSVSCKNPPRPASNNHHQRSHSKLHTSCRDSRSSHRISPQSDSRQSSTDGPPFSCRTSCPGHSPTCCPPRAGGGTLPPGCCRRCWGRGSSGQRGGSAPPSPGSDSRLGGRTYFISLLLSHWRSLRFFEQR